MNSEATSAGPAMHTWFADGSATGPRLSQTGDSITLFWLRSDDPRAHLVTDALSIRTDRVLD
jgi:hypothetical protein